MNITLTFLNKIPKEAQAFLQQWHQSMILSPPQRSPTLDCALLPPLLLTFIAPQFIFTVLCSIFLCFGSSFLFSLCRWISFTLLCTQNLWLIFNFFLQINIFIEQYLISHFPHMIYDNGYEDCEFFFFLLVVT